MNENTNANGNATAIDDETLARAVLTYCLDSADAMMYALIKGIGSATHTLQLLADSGQAIMKTWPRPLAKPWMRRSSTASRVGGAASTPAAWPHSMARWFPGSIV